MVGEPSPKKGQRPLLGDQGFIWGEPSFSWFPLGTPRGNPPVWGVPVQDTRLFFFLFSTKLTRKVHNAATENFDAFRGKKGNLLSSCCWLILTGNPTPPPPPKRKNTWHCGLPDFQGNSPPPSQTKAGVSLVDVRQTHAPAPAAQKQQQKQQAALFALKIFKGNLRGKRKKTARK